MLRRTFTLLLSFVATVLTGITAVFFITRLNTTDPVDALLAKMTSMGRTLTNDEYTHIRQTLTAVYGLTGSLWDQYWRFLFHNLIQFDFGPSLSQFPTPAIVLIARALPWTAGLLVTSTIISWLLGNLIGLFVGLKPRSPWARVIEFAAVAVYPVPYYIMALLLIVVFCYVWPVFPLSTYIGDASLSVEFLGSILYNSFLPGLSIALTSMGWWIISMKALSAGEAQESYVRFARLRGVPGRTIATKYVFRNALLPQVTVLAIQLGLILSGAVLTEILFQYPGVGLLLYRGVSENDYNLLLGTIEISIIAVAGATLLIELFYPLIDPRIRVRSGA